MRPPTDPGYAMGKAEASTLIRCRHTASMDNLVERVGRSCVVGGIAAVQAGSGPSRFWWCRGGDRNPSVSV